MKITAVIERLRSDGFRGFTYDVAAYSRLPRERRELRQGRPGKRGDSSITDDGEYPVFCQKASEDDAVFDRFRRSAIYMRVLEHVSRAQGSGYVSELERRPFGRALLGTLSSVPEPGGPRTYRFGAYGELSPTTLRYAKVAADLEELFGTLDGSRVAEIGVGYGGQCRIIMRSWEVGAYHLFDLPPVLALTERFLVAAGAASDRVVAHDALALDSVEADLVVSNYAFSELRREVQQEYLDRVILRAPRGYLTYNHTTPPEWNTFTAEEIAAMIPGSEILPEVPLTAARNVIVAWGHRAA
jgi:hypothetical protein